METREFILSYFSEVSTAVTAEIRTDGVRLSATHTVEKVPISDWFHFSGEKPDADPLVVRAERLDEGLAGLAHELYPGAEHFLDLWHVGDKREKFYSDVLVAFMTTKWLPVRDEYARGYVNVRAAEVLLNADPNRKT